MERKAWILRKRELFLFKAQARVMMDSPTPSDVGGVFGSIFPCKVELLIGPLDERAHPESPASLHLIQLKNGQKLRRTQSSTASVIAMMIRG